MTRLLLLRHAKSDWSTPGLDDFDRPLAPRGQRAAALMARHLADHAPRPDLVLCSPARRARDTLGLVLKPLDGVPVCFEQALYVFDHPPLLARLRRLAAEVSCVLVIGHNPALEDLARALAGPASEPEAKAALVAKFPTAALATLETPASWAGLAAGSARLVDFTTPKSLAGAQGTGDDDGPDEEAEA